MWTRPALSSRLSRARALRISFARWRASICWAKERSGGAPDRPVAVVGGDGAAGDIGAILHGCAWLGAPSRALRAKKRLKLDLSLSASTRASPFIWKLQGLCGTTTAGRGY